MVWINSTDGIGLIIAAMTTSFTGSLFLTLLLLTAVLTVLPMAFGLPLELSMIAVFPFLVVAATVESAFMPVLAIGILYLTVILVKALMRF